MPGYWILVVWWTTQITCLVSLWIGLVVLSLKGRTSEWWLMASGAAGLSIGLPLVSVALSNLFPDGIGALLVLLIAGSLSGLALLLFCGGFILHGTWAARAQGRLLELEELSAAMAEEAGQRGASAGD